MKKTICCAQGIFFIVFLMAASVAAQQGSPASSSTFKSMGGPTNSISGFIFDAETRTPLADVYVELQTDTYSTLRRIKTDGSGRYTFVGMQSGQFRVRVLPYRTNYMEQEEDVNVVNYQVGGTVTSDAIYLDFYLKIDKRKANIDTTSVTGAVFAQDVPSEARNLYKKSLNYFKSAKDEQNGFEALKKAIELFPDYYDALNQIGLEYVKRKQYQEALPYLVKAIDVNKRSFSSFYLLGLAAFNLKQMNEAAEAFRATTIINPQSSNAFLQYGMVLRINNNYKESEQALLKAQSLLKDLPSSEVCWQLALLYDRLKRYNEAADQLEKYLQINPTSEKAAQIKTLITQFREKAKTV
jgi:tetratricopeptide (TPR) repeat protein